MPPLTLTLFMAWVVTDDQYPTMTSDNLALIAHFFN